MSRFRIALLSVIVAGIASFAIARPSTSADLSSEAAFRDARSYTVRIRTRIETPFLGEEQGAFQGAGFLVDARRGWIVTNAHVVGESPSDIQIAFADGKYYPARKLYVDSFADIAVISLDRPVTDHPAARLERTAPPVVGETIGAFGHPLGVPFTGTRGIVSGVTDQAGPDLIQIDATVDHGNSGGPVIAFRDGSVLGIATYKSGRNERDRLNFATPIAGVRRILALLREGRSPSPPAIRFALFKDDDGRYTMEVARTFDTNAWPFEPGDRIVSVQGHPGRIQRLEDLVTALRGRTGPVAVTVERGDMPVNIVTHPTLRHSIIDRRGISIDGALIAPLAFEDGAVLSDATPLIIHSVDPSSTAMTLDLQPLDMIHRVDGRAFESLDSLITYAQSRSGEPLRLEIRRLCEETYRLFEYHVRELPGADVKLVGPPEKSPVASR